MKLKTTISNAILLLVILVIAGCGSTSGSKIAATTPADSVNERRGDISATTPVAAQEKGCENPVAGQNENLSDTEPNYPDFTEEFGGRDPLEGFNRSMFAVNKFGLRYILQPIIIAWGSMIPRHGIECIKRCTNNIAFPKRTFSSLCQAKFKYAGIDTCRFLINVTLGVAGFYDPALDWFDMEEQDEDFGQAFAVWGIGPGFVLHLPVLGQSNFRDGVGKIFDYAFDPKTYVPYPGVLAFTMLNESAHSYRDMDTFYRANYDPYELLKRFYSAERYFKINDYDRAERMKEYQEKISSEENGVSLPEPEPLLNQIVVRGFESQGPGIDTLRIGMVRIQNDNKSMWIDLSLWNSDFFNQGSIRSVNVIKGKSGMPYKVWYQKKNDAPLAVLVPGFGSHYTTASNSAVSEILFNQGYTVVALSSAFNWEFMSTAASVPVPGYIPSDSEDVRTAIAAVINDLEHNGLKFKKKILVGYSLGGMHALFIGAKEKEEPKLKFDRFVAINPVVEPVIAVAAIDEMAPAWKKWPRKQVFERGVLAASKYMSIAKKQFKPYEEPEPANENNSTVPAADCNGPIPAAPTDKTVQGVTKQNYQPLPFTDTEARTMISYNYKITLEEMILSIVENNKVEPPFKSRFSWGNRTDFYHEINQMSFAEYNKMFLLNYHTKLEKREVSVNELNEKSSLLAIDDFLRNGQNVFVIHSSNDFLVNSSERQWLNKTMGDRCIFYNIGGHLGNLYLAGVQNRLASLACDLEKQTSTSEFKE